MTSQQESGRDVTISSAVSCMFSFTNGAISLILPVLAADSGISPARIGILYAAATSIQVPLRPLLAYSLRTISDRALVQAGSIAQLMSLLVLLHGITLHTLALSWAFQSLARASFWTGMDTHAIRNPSGAAHALGSLHAWASIGLLAGPLAAGLISQQGINWTLGVGITLSALGLATGALLLRHPLPTRISHTDGVTIWASPGIGATLFAGAAAGSWRGLMDSVIPAVLRDLGQSFTMIGLAISLSTALSIPGAAIVTRLHSTKAIRRAYTLSVLATAIAVGTIAAVTTAPQLAYLPLALGGLGAGVLQTLGPLLASLATSAYRAGEAIAWHGFSRTLSTLTVPGMTALLVPVLPITASLALIGGILALTARSARSIGAEEI